MNPQLRKNLTIITSSLAAVFFAYLVFATITSPKTEKKTTAPPTPSTPQLVAFGNPSVENLPNEGKEITIPVIKKGEFLPRSVKVSVYIYEQGKDGTKVVSRSPTPMKFASPVDWKDTGVEDFKISYPGPIAPSKQSYAGYIIGLYYENVLQDQISAPKSLADEFPLPKTLKGSNIR